ncbi:MAG: helix-turn-helix domain-containing protein, partial [Solimonas sp.]
LHGMVLTGARGGLLADHLQSLLRRMPALTTEDAGTVMRATTDFFAALVAPSADNLARARDPIRSLMFERATRHIEQALCTPNLAPDSIAATLGISRATLYRLFEPLGGIQAYVRKRRLLRIRDALLDPAEGRHIATLAYAHGFASETHFSRAFRQLFGVSASELRRMRHEWLFATRQREDASLCAHERIQSWVRQLGA